MLRIVIASILILSVSAANLDISSRLVGGNLALPNQFPYMASLRFRNGNEHMCGGSILNERWILTAAHCALWTSQISELVIVVGALNRFTGGVPHEIETYHVHNFSWDTLVNDVSTIKTKTRITYSSSVQPINLGSNIVGGGVKSIISGWGYTSLPGQLSDNLKYLEQTTITREQCQRDHGTFPIFDSTLCAVGAPRTGICHSDSGGPLIADKTLIGVAYFALDCATGISDGYARVSFFRSWIVEHSRI